MTSVEARRFLFIPTQTDWTAFFDNGHQGTDAFAPISYLAKEIGCVGVRATDALPGRTQGGTVFELYSAEDTDWLNVVRSISAAPTDGQWAFTASGTTLSFETIEFYAKRRIKDRFNSEILKQYLEELAIDAFNPDFYAKEGFLVEKVGTFAPAMQLFGLAN